MQIELDTVEAHLMITPLSIAIAGDEIEAARSKGEAAEYASLRAAVRQRVLTKIVDQLTPDRCRWMDDEECPRPIASDGLCTVHLDHKRKVAQILGASA